MRFAFIHAERTCYPLTVLCACLRVSRAGYYAWRDRAPSDRHRCAAARAEKVRAVHAQSRATYGSPRVWRQLRQQGEVISRKTVAKLMRAQALAARPKRKFRATTDSRHTTRIAPNRLDRDFTAARPNQVWVTDVTAVWTTAGWCYLAAILDLFARRVVGWALSDCNDTTLARTALERALSARRPGPGLLHHSDRGSPYGADDYIAVLDAHGIERSMSRTGDCWDNAVAESFFASFEHECRGRYRFHDLADAQRVIGDYIDQFYNLERLHSTLDYVSPIEFELRASQELQPA